MVGSERMVAAVALGSWARIEHRQEAVSTISQLAEQCQTMLASGNSNPPKGFLEIQRLCRGIQPQLHTLLKQAAAAGFGLEVCLPTMSATPHQGLTSSHH